MGGKVEIIQGQRASDEVVAYARANGINKIIVGSTPKARWKEMLHGTLVREIIARN